MELKFVKFSDERRKEFCIKTIIKNDAGKMRVWKEPVFAEGIAHIESIARNRELLEQCYDNKICGVEITDGRAEFEYINGKTLEEKYNEALKLGDLEEYEKLLLFHKKIITGKESNITSFVENEKCSSIFGDCRSMTGKPALKCCNYDMIAGNIIFDGHNVVIIDYEWVFDCMIPLDYVLYHCIENYYEHYSESEELYPLDKALKYIGIETDSEILRESYRSFYNYVISDGNSEGYALMKRICLKNSENMVDIKRKKIEYECECNRLQGVIDGINKELIDKAIVLESVKKELKRVAEESAVIERKYNRTIRGVGERIIEKVRR